MGPSGKLHSGKKEQNRTVRSLRTFFLEAKISQVPPVSIQATKTSTAQQRPPGQSETQEGKAHGIRDRYPGKKREVLCGCVETGLGKLRYNWS